MPIFDRTADGCFAIFGEHMRALFAQTLTKRYKFLITAKLAPDGSKAVDRIASFHENREAVCVPIDTKVGKLYLYVAQQLRAVCDDSGKRYRLSTIKYWYRLHRDPNPREQALIRWEYDTAERGARPCRNHIQQATHIALQDQNKLDLNHLHVPTGWVTIEELIRFLIFDLGMKPPCGSDAWPKVLEQSEGKFYEEFTSKRYKPKLT